MPEKFTRFVRQNLVCGMSAREGFFNAAYELRENDEVDLHTSEQLEDLLAWFRQNLPIPNKFTRSKSKGKFRKDTKGLSWFKPEASSALAKAYALVSLLEQNGYAIETVHSSRIGYIVFEDEQQVIVEPFSDTPT